MIGRFDRILNCMIYLCMGIDVPHTKRFEGIPLRMYKRDRTLALINIRTSTTIPKNYYVAIKYKGDWYYIDEEDLNSKRSFVLLMQLYTLQSTREKKVPPPLTLPLG